MSVKIETYKQPSFRTFLAILLGVLTAAITVPILSNFHFLAWMAGICLILTGLYPLIRGMRRQNLDIFEPIFPFVAYFILLLGIRGLYDLRYGSPLLSPLYDITSDYYYSLMARVFLYSILSLICFYAGYYSRLGTAIANSLPRLPTIYWKRRQIVTAVGFSIVIGILVMRLVHMTQFSLMGRGGFWLYSLAKVPIIGLGILYINSLVKKSVFKEIVSLLAIMAATFLIFSITWKTLVFDAAILVLVPYHYLKKRFNFKMISLTLVLLILTSPLLFWYHGAQNLETLWGNFTFALAHPYKLIEPLLMRSHGADSFAVILDKTPNVYNFQLGGTLSQLLWFYIPRAIWSEKPFTYSWHFGKTYMGYTHYVGPFVAPTFVGELYINLSWVGIMVGSLLTGIIFKIVYAYFIKRHGDKTAILIYALILPRLIFLAEGPIAELMSRLLSTLIFVLILLTIVTVLSTPLGQKGHLIIERGIHENFP